MSSEVAHGRARDGLSLGRYLPLAVSVTLAVTLLPLIAVAQLGPARGAASVGLHVLAAVVLSALIARVLAAIWSRHEQSSDIVFGDLLLWGWLRRALAERRLDAATRELAAPPDTGEDRVALLRRLSTLLETRDPYTHGHSRRVARHSEQIAKRIGLSGEQIARIRAAALVHDIGKINVPRAVLTKRSALTDAEFALVKRHARDGAAMVSELGDPELAAIVRHHHERIDGTGYPDGLSAEDIPLGARVIAVADTFDAITSTRAYRKPRTHRKAIEILEREANAQLDAGAVAAFVSYYSARRSVELVSVLATAPQRLLSGLGGVQSGVAAGVAPIAQAACGVGGIALIGACLGSPMPAEPTSADVRSRTTSEQVASTIGGAGQAGPQQVSNRSGARAQHGQDAPATGRGQSRSDGAPRGRGDTRAVETPEAAPPATDPVGTGGGGTVTPPKLPDLPDVPDPPKPPTAPTLPSLPSLPVAPPGLRDIDGALAPVSQGLRLPSVQAPALPQVGLP